MEAVKTLEVQPPRTPRRMGRGTHRRWRRELERPSPARWSAKRTIGASSPITVTPGSGHRAEWASEAVIVPIEPSGQHNRR